MEQLYNFVHTLSHFSNTSENIVTKSLKTMFKFEVFFNKILELDAVFKIQNDIRSLVELDDISMEVTSKLDIIDSENGELLKRIQVNYPILYNQIECGHVDNIIELYSYILYSIRYIVESNDVNDVNDVNEVNHYNNNILNEIAHFTPIIVNDLMKEFIPYSYPSADEVREDDDGSEYDLNLKRSEYDLNLKRSEYDLNLKN